MELNHDKEILDFIRGILHNYTYLLMDLRHALYDAKKMLQYQRPSEQIAKAENVTQELHLWIKRMQFLTAEDELIGCDFLRDVFEPLTQWNWQGDPIHIGRDSSARNAPAILIRPRLATWGLIQIYHLLHPSVRCSGEQRDNRFTFVITLERKVIASELPSVDKAREVLMVSGAEVQLSLARTELAITLYLARTQSS